MAKTNAVEKMVQIADSMKGHRERHLDALGDWQGEVFHSQVLAMTYIQRSRTEGGIIIPDRAQEEDRFQGKIFMVVALGPGAFKDDKIAQFHGATLKPGDWFMARPSDGLEFFYNGNTLRLFQDVDVRIKIEDPGLFW